MLKNKIQSEILSHLNFNPTLGQMVAIDGLASFVINPKPDSCILLKGYAGTGKIVLLCIKAQIVNAIRIIASVKGANLPWLV